MGVLRSEGFGFQSPLVTQLLCQFLNEKHFLCLQTGMALSLRPPCAAAEIVDLHAATPVHDLRQLLNNSVTLLPPPVCLSQQLRAK